MEVAGMKSDQSRTWADITGTCVVQGGSPDLENCRPEASHANKEPMAWNIKFEEKDVCDDLRTKLNSSRNRRGSYQTINGSRGAGRRDSHRARSNHSSGGTSPLRSPLQRSKGPCIIDMDNSRNFRFTNHRLGGSPNEDVYPNRRHYSKSSPGRHPRNKWVVERDSTSESEEPSPRTVFSDSEEEDGTPMLNKISSSRGPRKSWSRRRLDLPLDNEDSDCESEKRLPPIREEDKVRLARRDKDISYGKNSDAYRKYISTVPRHRRSRDLKVHPRTPEKYEKCSRRSWDSQVKIWKRRIHAWVDRYQKETNPKSDQKEKETEEEQSQDTEEGEVTEATASIESEERDESTEYSDDDNFDLNDEEESFLDSMNINFSVAEGIEETVTLKDE